MAALTLWLAVAWLLDVAQFNVCRGNYRAKYSGFGCLRTVREKKALAPMAYRVLAPFAVGWIKDDGAMLMAYECLKILLMGAGLYIQWVNFGLIAALVAAVLWVSTFQYDYWDVYGEFLGFGLVLTCSLPLALAGSAVAGLSKETALITPLIYFAATRDALGALGVLVVSWGTMLAVRMWVGHRRMYCPRWMLGQNWKDLRRQNGWVLGQQVVSIMWIGAAVFSVVISWWTVPSVGAVAMLLLAGCLLGRITEPRIFLSTSIWIGAAVAKVVGG